MSGYPHGLEASPGDALPKPGHDYVLRGNEIKPGTHVTDWREDGVASVRWCDGKYLFNAELVLKPGETKPCPACGLELHHDEKKKEVVEGGFPCVPNRTGGGMRELREVLEGLLTEDESVRLNVQVLAPVVEKGLRVTAQEMAEMLTRVEAGDWLIDQCVTAGVAAMVEKP